MQVWRQRYNRKQFGHLERKEWDELKKIYKNGVDAMGVRERPPTK